VKEYKVKEYIGKVNNNRSKCLSCSTPPKACSYHRIRREVLQLIMVLSPYYLLHRSPHSRAGIGLRRRGIWKVYIETNYGHRKTLVLWSEEMEWADFCPLTLPLQTADKVVRALVLYSKDLSASPALPTTQLGRLDYLSKWVYFGRCGYGPLVYRKKKTSLFQWRYSLGSTSRITERMAHPRASPYVMEQWLTRSN
jgi:hypothetical protein